MRYWNYDTDGPAATPTYSVSRGLKKQISEELGDTLVDLARLADFLESEKKMGELDDPVFEEWFTTVVNQVKTMSGLVEDIHRMLQTSEAGEDNPLKNVRILPPRFSMSPSGIV